MDPEQPKCSECHDDGVSVLTAEPILSPRKNPKDPLFQPKPLLCGWCERRKMGVEPYSIWHLPRYGT